MTTKEEKPKRVKKLLAGKLKRAEHVRLEYEVVCEDGETLEDILAPEFWAHVGGKQVKARTQIGVYLENDTRYVELIVVAAGPLWAKVVVKSDTSLVAAKGEAKEVAQAVDDAAPYKPVYKGPSHKWTVIRSSDGEIIEKGLDSKDEAAKWIENFQKSMAA